MTSPLANPAVKDSDAIVAVQKLDMPPSRRPALWRERWDASAALQREFSAAETYVAYMEGRCTGRVRQNGFGSS